MRVFPTQSPNLSELLWLCLCSKVFLGLAFLSFILPKSRAVLEVNDMVVPTFLGCIRWWALLWSHIPQTWALYLRYLPNCCGVLAFVPWSVSKSKQEVSGLSCPPFQLFQLFAFVHLSGREHWVGADLAGGHFSPALWPRQNSAQQLTQAEMCWAETLGLGYTSCGHRGAGSLWTTTAHPELDCRTGCTFVFISCHSRSLGIPRTSEW